jgi:hypothetical protein
VAVCASAGALSAAAIATAATAAVNEVRFGFFMGISF